MRNYSIESKLLLTMKTILPIWIILFVCQFATAQEELHLEDEQAVARLSTTDSNNGAVLTLRNTTTGGLTGRYLGAINFDREFSTSGQIGYQTQFLGPDKINFRVGGAEILNLFDTGALTTNILELANGALCTQAGVWTNSSSIDFEYVVL